MSIATGTRTAGESCQSASAKAGAEVSAKRGAYVGAMSVCCELNPFGTFSQNPKGLTCVHLVNE